MTTRTSFLGGLLVFGAAALPASLVSSAGAGTALHALPSTACTGSVAVIASDWGVTEAWRALAPYPVPREASPTNSVGVWVERSHLPNGDTELRRVSAAETEVVTFDASNCVRHRQTHKRSYNADSMRNAFTDASLDSLMRTSERGLIYVWSPRMPLSVKGLPQARQAARDLGITFTALVAEANDAELNGAGANALDRRRMESLELVYRNATIHYPAVLLYNGGHVVDGVFPGYKNRETYAQYAKRQFQHEQPENRLLDEQKLFTPNSGIATADTTFWVDRKARVTTLFTVNTLRRIGFFFKPITGTNLISYTSEDIAYFFDLKTNKEQLVPGHVDPVPTPDGRFLTLPGLHFHPIPALLAGNRTPAFTDRALPDEYQTASILSESRNAIRYRIVTGWHAGARFRDYDVAFNGSGALTGITAVGEPFVPCSDRTLTLPINAKSGREFGAYDVGIKSNVILEVVNNNECKLKLDLGFASGKLSFSYDGAAVAFATSRINTDATGTLIRPSESFYKDALVLFRKTGRIVSLSQNVAVRGMTFPEFQKDGTVMLLDQVAPGRPVEQMRVVSVK